MRFIHIPLILLFFTIDFNPIETNQWNKLINVTHVWSKSVASDLRRNYLALIKSTNVSVTCNQSLLATLNGIQDMNLWAIRLINSWGQFPSSGVLIGTSTDFGSYDQCLDIEPNTIIDRPQYCLIDVRPPLPQAVHHNFYGHVDVLPVDYKNNGSIFEAYSKFASFYYWFSLRTGVCVPSKCSEQDITALTKRFVDDNGLQFRRVQCQTRQVLPDLNIAQIVAITLLSLMILVTSIATLRDNPNSGRSSRSSTFVDTFSLKRNSKRLFAERTSESLACVHGIRVFTITWIVIGHTIEWTNYQLYGRAFIVKQLFDSIFNHIFLNVYYSVDTFFIIAGILTSYITLQLTKSSLSRFSVVGFLISKYIRLTPQLIFFILLTFLIPLGGFSAGPIWKETVDPLVDNCSNNWWHNLLYIQNMFRGKTMCGLHTWFLAADMQYHWISIFFIVPLLYNIKLGNILAWTGVVIFYLVSIVISYYLDLPPGLLNSARDEHFYNFFFDLFYMKPWSHATVFFIGYLLGIALFNARFTKMNLVVRNLLIFLIITGYAVCLLDTYYWIGGKPYNRLVSGVIYATCRVIWSLSTSALIWLCVSGNGGLINRVLSAHIFTPLSRLTYSVYLTHAWVVWLYVATRRQQIDTNWTDLTFIVVHNVIISYLVGFLFAILFEMPVLRLQKQIKLFLFERSSRFKMAQVEITPDTNNNGII